METLDGEQVAVSLRREAEDMLNRAAIKVPCPSPPPLSLLSLRPPTHLPSASLNYTRNLPSATSTCTSYLHPCLA